MKFKVGDFVRFPKERGHIGTVVEAYRPAKSMWLNEDHQVRYKIKESKKHITAIIWLDEDQLEIIKSLKNLKEFLS